MGGGEGDDPAALPPAGLTPARQRSLRALLRKAPSALDWCRRRWSCATLAASLPAAAGRVSAETVRRWRHALSWRRKCTRPAARDDDPERASKLARIRLIWEGLRPREAVLFADEMDIHLPPKSGCRWMEKGTQTEALTPGKNEKRCLAGAWDVRTGAMRRVVWCRKQAGLFVDLLQRVGTAHPARRYDRVYVVADNHKIRKAAKVELWLHQHPRVELVFQPTCCPRAA